MLLLSMCHCCHCSVLVTDVAAADAVVGTFDDDDSWLVVDIYQTSRIKHPPKLTQKTAKSLLFCRFARIM